MASKRYSLNQLYQLWIVWRGKEEASFESKSGESFVIWLEKEAKKDKQLWQKAGKQS